MEKEFKRLEPERSIFPREVISLKVALNYFSPFSALKVLRPPSSHSTTSDSDKEGILLYNDPIAPNDIGKIMGAKSTIEWTEATWNPVTGCTKISPGCKHCYAEKLALRLKAMGQRNYAAGFDLTLQPHMLELPLTWKKPQTIFVNSMSDLFHDKVPLEYIKRVFDVMNKASWHRFQVLTKRAERLAEMSSQLDWTANIWMGVSVESEKYISRIDHLRLTEAQIKFLSLEPLLGPLRNLDLRAIHWAIVGGESGPGARIMNPRWVMEIRDQCKQANVPFFFKQWGGVQKKRFGRILDGRTYDEMPIPPI